MKFGGIHFCCIAIAIVVLFFLLNRVSMYTDDSKPMTCTCTSASESAPANTVAPAAGATMMPGAMTPGAMTPGAMTPGSMMPTDSMIGN